MGMKVIVHGNPMDGFKIIGPFQEGNPDAEYIVDRILDRETCWILPIASVDKVFAEGI